MLFHSLKIYSGHFVTQEIGTCNIEVFSNPSNEGFVNISGLRNSFH